MPLLQLSQSQDPMLRAVKYIIKTKKFCFLGLLVPKLLKTLTLCLVRVKRRGKTRERGKWEGKCYFPPFGSVEKTEGMENRGENKSPGPTKIHLPKLGRKQRREKAPILKWRIYPLRLSIWVKVSQVAVTVAVALCRSSKFHAVDFATHKISRRRLRHPQNFTSPPTNSHAIEFATHKISHRHPQNLMPSTSPPTKPHTIDFATHKISHRLPQNLVSYSSDVLSVL